MKIFNIKNSLILFIIICLSSFFNVENRYYQYLNYLYEDAVFTYIATKYIKGRNNIETIENLSEYIAEHVTADSYSHAPTSEFVALLHGNGLCSVNAIIALMLLEKSGVKSRIAHSAVHTFVEINLNGKWILFEQFGGVLYKNNLDQILTSKELFWHIKNEKDYLVKKIGRLAVKGSFSNQDLIFDYIQKLYTPIDYLYLDYWLKNKKRSCFNIENSFDPKKIEYILISKINSIFIYFFGKYYLRFIQSIYFSYLYDSIFNYDETSYIATDFPKTAGFVRLNILNLFSNQDNLTTKELNESYSILRARCCHLIENYDEEENIYKNLLKSKLNDKHKLYTLYYYGFLLYKSKRYSDAIEKFQILIHIDQSKSFKIKPVLYFIGRCYEKMGNKTMALEFYKKAATTPLRYYSEFQFKRASMHASQIENSSSLIDP